MRRFRFTLEAVRTLRQRREQVALEQYARAVRVWQSTLEALNEVQRQCEDAWQLQRERTQTGALAAHLAQVQDYCAALGTLKEHCEAAVAAARRVVDQKLEALHETRRARKAVDKFFKRRRERYDYELLREEQKTSDDLAQRCGPRTSLVGKETRWESS
jgi:flagellar export protein FliJ